MGQEAKPKTKNQDIEENKMIATLSYIWVLCLVPLFLKRKSPFVQFHAKQGLVLFVVEIAGWLIFWIPLVGQLLFLALVVLSVYGIIQVWQGVYWEMPVLGKYAQRIKI